MSDPINRLFDVNKKFTEFYKKGHLVLFEDGKVILLLKRFKSRQSSSENYDEQFRGVLGQEVLETYFKSKQPKPLKRCPNDNVETTLQGHASVILLKSEHGCIRQIRSLSYIDYSYSYFRADGKKIDLQVPNGDYLGYGTWVSWVEAYILGDTVTISSSRTEGIVKSAPSVKLLYPSGDLKLIEISEYSSNLTYVRPTRAGMIAAKLRPEGGAFISRSNGLFLWREGQQYQITEGNVSRVEVSPDGCKVAYYYNIRNTLSRTISEIGKLRVIDVCEGFGVAKDANPFK